MGEFQLRTSGNLVGEKEVVPDKPDMTRKGSFRRGFKRELESEGGIQPVLERVSYKTDEVNRNWPDQILIIMISPLVLYDLWRPSTHTRGDHCADLHDLH